MSYQRHSSAEACLVSVVLRGGAGRGMGGLLRMACLRNEDHEHTGCEQSKTGTEAGCQGDAECIGRNTDG